MIVDNFENIILDLERRKENMRNIFDRADKNIERINETDVWTSPAEREFYSKYKEQALFFLYLSPKRLFEK